MTGNLKSLLAAGTRTSLHVIFGPYKWWRNPIKWWRARGMHRFAVAMEEGGRFSVPRDWKTRPTEGGR